MNRKHFLATILPASIAANALAQTKPHKNHQFHPDSYRDKNPQLMIPPYLKTGDTIGITSPAGYITLKDIEPAVAQITSWGFQVKIGDTIGKRDFTYGGTDAERLQDFQAMLDNHSIKAILCARGGYGAVRIIDNIDFTNFRKRPKWVIGFSDITVLHSHIHQQYNVATIHSKMCNSFPDDWSLADAEQKATILSIKDALQGTPMVYNAIPTAENVWGKAKGVLVGGNLKTLESLAASTSDIDTAGKILFVEDTGEYLYSIDRMFWNLQRSGKLKHLAGLIVGGFKIKEDLGGEPFGKTVYEIIKEKLEGYHYPVCFNFPVGHQRNNYALKCGIIHELDVAVDKVIFKDIIK
ncbi:LD-carboxypeptidase [Parasediminibacterium paludis]|uniref:LD-carboxypeptidase n=1 Tax=Parasediminibacterium paludis TaxID=908966 RepID=A0ABV8Q1B5_9BACT